jgi:hypothetical protein
MELEAFKTAALNLATISFKSSTESCVSNSTPFSSKYPKVVAELKLSLLDKNVWYIYETELVVLDDIPFTIRQYMDKIVHELENMFSSSLMLAIKKIEIIAIIKIAP